MTAEPLAALRARGRRIGAVWRLCRLAAPPGPRRLGMFGAALAASGLAAIPIAVAAAPTATGATGDGPRLVVIPAEGEPVTFPGGPITGAVQELIWVTERLDGSLLDMGGTSFRLDANVLFAFDSADLSAAAADVLADLVARLEAARAEGLEVEGHTDDVGDPAYNRRLSQRRADAVAARLRTALGGGVEIVATGRGESEPAASNETDEGRAKNRRVTVTVTQ